MCARRGVQERTSGEISARTARPANTSSAAAPIACAQPAFGECQESEPDHRQGDGDAADEALAARRLVPLDRSVVGGRARSEGASQEQPEEHRERGKQDDAARDHRDDHRDQRVTRRGGILDRQARQQVGRLSESPAGDHRSHGQGGGVAGRFVAAFAHQPKRGRPGQLPR